MAAVQRVSSKMLTLQHGSHHCLHPPATVNRLYNTVVTAVQFSAALPNTALALCYTLLKTQSSSVI